MIVNQKDTGISNNSNQSTSTTNKSFWYAVYTRPHHEKKIDATLKREDVTSFLPLQSTIKQWSDRKKKVVEPMFSCYLFVFISQREYYKVLNIPGVIRFVSFEGKAVQIPEKQIKIVKEIQECRYEFEEVNYDFQKGNKVKIKFGNLKGIKGELISYNSKKRVLLRIEEINKSLLINVPLNYLELVNSDNKVNNIMRFSER
jgi:transcriptional antiterminator RfaH